MFYRWQKEFFENGAAGGGAPLPTPRRREGSADRCPGAEAPTQARSPLGTHGGTYQAKKRGWGTLNGSWVPQATRDAVVRFIRHWAGRTGLSLVLLVVWLGIAMSKFSRWDRRLGTPNRHNAPIPRSSWLEDWEKAAIVAFHDRHPLDGYRRLAYMMLDADVVAVSPSSVYRVLKAAGKLSPRVGKSSRKGKGFEQPARHEHWHVDVSYINICGTFFYLCSLLDGYSRFLVHWEIRESMTERDVETIVQRARERFPEARPRIISDNGPQFVSWEFKQFIRICGMTHVRTSPYYPQSNGKMERWFKTAKGECIRVKTPLSLEDASAIARRVRGALQHGPLAQRDRLRPRRGQAGRPRGGDLGRAEQETGRGRGPAPSRAGPGDCGAGAVNCPSALARSRLEGPGRRIGQRGDATRAPTQGPRPGWAARCRPSASRDWPECDKSIYSSLNHRLAWRARSFFPFTLNQHSCRCPGTPPCRRHTGCSCRSCRRRPPGGEDVPACKSGAGPRH